MAFWTQKSANNNIDMGKCKIITYIFLIFLAPEAQPSATDIFYNDVSANSIRIIEESGNATILEYSLPALHLEELEIDGERMTHVTIPGCFLPNEAGYPNLPSFGRFIAIPEGSVAELEILSYTSDTLTNISIMPAFEIPLDKDADPLVRKKNPGVYNSPGCYPVNPVSISDPYEIRGIDAVMAGITPFAYYPLQKKLVVFSKIRFQISITGGTGVYVDIKYRSRSWDHILQNIFLNRHVLAQVDYSWMLGDNLTGCEYLIIAPDKPEFLSWADSIKNFRTTQGILTRIIPVSEIGNTAYDLDHFFEDIYYNWQIPPSAVLLLADYDNGTDGITSSQQVHTETGRYVTDNEFADVNGDNLPDIAFARITAANSDHLETMIGKFLKYERHPPENPHFYNRPVSAMGWETTRWFQLCSEVIYGFWENALNKEPVRENCIFYGTPGGPWSTAPNTGTVVDYFGQNGLGYIPDSSGHLTDWGGNAQRINNDLNNGAFMMQHRDHGFEIGWGEPSYTIYDIPGLYNEDPTFIFSVNCLTGKFNWENECFAEAFHRHDWGALGLIAASAESFSFVNDTYVWGLYDFMWPDFMPDYGTSSSEPCILPCFANIYGKYFLEQSGWPYNTQHKKITYQLFHHHGDAFTVVYSEMPDSLTIIHDTVFICDSGTFNFVADSGASVALTANGEILAVENGTGSVVQVPMPYLLPGSKIRICATRQNYFRYERVIDVKAPDGPFVLAYSHSVNDSLGNNNGIIEAGETVFLSLSMKNEGNLTANNVTAIIGPAPQGAAVTDSVENYGTILPGQFVSIYNGFSITVDSSVADNTKLQFTVTSTDGQNTWTSYCNLTAFAPVPPPVGFRIDDELCNNNGVAEAGEETVILIKHVNHGGGCANEIACNLFSPNNHLGVPDPDYTIYSMLPGDTAVAMFTLLVDSLFTDKTFVPLYYSFEYSGNVQYDTFLICLNQISETWETGSFDQFSWETGGDAAWKINHKDALSGSYSALSGYIVDEQISYIKIGYVAAEDDSISFSLKVSSEEDWDFLKFSIDSVLMDEWSGDTLTTACYPVSAGPHEFFWLYEKDMFVSEGKDCAMLDNIVFPPRPEVYAGPDFTVCENTTALLSGKAKYQNTVQWITDGTGYFEHPDSLVTGYVPGSEDIENGSVKLILKINHDFGTLEDSINLFINKLPETALKPSGDTMVCQNGGPSGYYTGPVNNALSYDWSLEPDNAGVITASNNLCTISWNDEYSGQASLKVRALNNCGEGNYSEELLIDIMSAPVVTLEPFGTVSVDEPPFPLSGGSPEGGVYTGNGVYNNYFYPQVAGAGTHIISYYYTNEYGCQDFDEQIITVELSTGFRSKPGGMISISPNPTTGVLFIESSGSAEELITIKIYNGTLQAVYSKSLKIKAGKAILDLSRQAPGLYYYNISHSGINSTGKLIITK